MTPDHFDVIVVGGGPAGASTGAILAEKGHRVVLFERERFPRFHIGESLLPAAWDQWNRLGVTPAMEAAGFVVKQGVNFGLFNAREDIALLTLEYPEYFFRPWTYHVERARYDEIMLDHARGKGVDVREGWEAADVLFEGRRAVGVMAGPVGGAAEPYRARVVVDASGRDCLLARRLGWRRPDAGLNKVAYFTHFEGAYRRETGGSVMTDIHTIDGGWFWYIPLARDIVSVGAVLDSEHVRALGFSGVQRRFDFAVQASPRVQEWVRSARQTMDVHTISNISYLTDSFVGDGFVLVGDASSFVDPIFSAGVTLAMRGGIFAADVIDEALRADDVSAARLAPYERQIRKPMDNIFRMIHNWYRMLKRRDADNLFARSRRIPWLRERLIVLLSGGYDKLDMEAMLRLGDT